MPTLELEPGDTRSIEDIVQFVRQTSASLSPNAREALLISLLRAFKAEAARIRERRDEESNA